MYYLMCSKIGRRECVDFKLFFVSKTLVKENKFMNYLVKFGEFKYRMKTLERKLRCFIIIYSGVCRKYNGFGTIGTTSHGYKVRRGDVICGEVKEIRNKLSDY